MGSCRAGAQTYFPGDLRVIWHRLDLGDARDKAGWRLRSRLQLAIQCVVSRPRPDAMTTFRHGPSLTVALASAGLGVPVIAAERNAPQRFDHLCTGRHRDRIFRIFRILFAPGAVFDRWEALFRAVVGRR